MKRPFAIVPAALVAALSVAPGVRSQGEWSSAAPAPTARKEIANATLSLNGKIYVAGGVARDGQISDKLEIYTPGTDSWSEGAALPQAVWRTSLASVGGKIYLFGGNTSTAGFPFAPTNRSYVYDADQDRWDAIADMPTARGTTAAVAIDGKLHVLGGANSVALNTHEVYDAQHDQWSTAAPVPTARSGLTAAVIDGLIYAAGGYFLSGGVVRTRQLEVYSPARNSWQSLPHMPLPRTGLDAEAVQGKLYLFGGPPAETTSRVLRYDPVTSSWQSMADMPTPVSFMGAATVNDTVYVIGGGPVNLNRFDAVNLNRVFVPPASPTSVRGLAELPKSFVLHQNFPNPFNPETRIVFETRAAGPVQLTISNTTGQLVSTLVNGWRPAGRHEASFDGSQLASGIYFYRLSFDGTSFSRMMTLAR